MPLNRHFPIFSLSTVLLTLYSSLSAQTALSLKDCLQFTLQHNPNSTIYQNNVGIYAQKLRENKAAFLPTVTAITGFNYNLKLATTIIPPGAFTPVELKIQMGSKFIASPYLEADQVFFDRTAIMDIRSARINRKVADLNVQKQNETLLFNTATSYYDALTYRQKQQLLQENEQQNLQLQGILRLRYEQGEAKKSEYDRATVNLKNVQAELAENRINYEQALNKLKNAMGMGLPSAITIPDSVDDAMIILPPDPSAPLDEKGLVDFQIDQQNILLKDIDVKKKKAAFLPTLSAFAQYGANANGSTLGNTFNQWFDYSVVGVKLTVPLFSGFKKSSQYRQSVLNAQNQRLTQQLNLESYRLEYQNSSAKLFGSYTSLIKNKETMNLAREVLDASTLEYREGKSTLSTLLDDDHSYKEARSNYITSLIDFLDSRLSLEKAKGNLIPYLNAQQ